MKMRAQQVAITTFLTAGLITEAVAALDIQFLDNSSTSANFSTSPPNDPTFLNSLGSGFATYAGVLSGTGTVMKLGPGTITLTNANTYTGPTAVRTGTLHITGSISHASSGLYVSVASGDNGRAVINSGGTATVSLVSTAEDANSTADVTVSGSGSMLTVGNTMRIGLYGTGTLLVESGGKVDITSFGILGENAGSHGTATVTGLSQLTTGGNLYVGYGSLGDLSIQNGGHVSSAGGRIGENAGSTGSATVSGAGSTWTNTARLYVGNIGSGTLLVENGGAVTSGALSSIGDTATGVGTVTITGTGSSWTNSSNLYIGNFGKGTLTVTNGGTLTSSSVHIADEAGSNGTLTLSAVGANRGQLKTGQLTNGAGTGSVTFNGGLLTATASRADFFSGFSVGNVQLGAGGAFIDTAGFDIGGAFPMQGTGGFTKLGNGTLTLGGDSSYGGQTTVNGGTLALTGTLSTAGVHLAENGFTSTVTVSGTGAALTASGFLTVGDNTGNPTPGGNGTLTIANGGTVTLGDGAKLTIGWTDATGTLNLNSGGTLQVGGVNGIQKAASGTAAFNFAGGTLRVVHSALTTNLPLALSGIATVDTNGLEASFGGALSGSGSLLKIGAGTLRLTTASTISGNTTVDGGLLSLQSGGTLATNLARIGENVSSNGQVMVSGPGSKWTVAGDLYIGNVGTGTLNILNGGAVTNVNSTRIGDKATGIGAVTVSGAGSSWTSSDFLVVGTFGTGTLTIADGGTVRAPLTKVGNDTGSSGTVLLSGTPSGRGVLETAQIARLAGSGALTFDGGILRATADHAQFITGFSSVQVNSGGAFVDTNGHNAGIAIPLTGSGGLTKQGTGTLTLAGNNTYSGGTTVSGGSLLVDANSRLGSGTLTLAGGTLRYGAAFNDLRAVTLGAGDGGLDTNGFDVTVASIISGTGALIKGGSGTLTLTGNNTYSGGTIVSAGTLQVGSGTVGSITGDIVNNATLAFSRSDNITYSGAISGTGALIKGGTGALTLSGNNTYSGGTTVRGGVLIIDANSRLGSGALSLENGTLRYGAAFNDLRSFAVNNGSIDTNGFDVSFGGDITGSGTLTKAGNGTLTLTTPLAFSGTFSSSGGTTLLAHPQALQNTVLDAGAGALSFGSNTAVTIGAISGSGNISLVNASSAPVALTLGRNLSTTYAGSFSGAGSLIKNSTGTFTLTGNNTHTGGTTINAGALRVGNNGTSGSITGDIVNNATLTFARSDAFTYGGVISGTGAVTKTSAGTLTLTGDNTYTGTTTISSGLIEFATPSNFGPSGTVRLNGGGLRWAAGNTADISSRLTLTNGTFDTNGNDVALASALTGTTLTKIGAGTLSLGGTNTFSGAITLNNGTLDIAGATTALGVHVAENGHTATLAVPGTLTISSASGFLTVGDNSGSPTPGGTGTLLIPAGGVVALTNGAKLTVGWTDASGAVTLAGTLRVGSANGIQKAATGTADFQLAGGTLQVVGSALTTSLPMTLSGSPTIDTNALAATLSGVLSGNGSLTKTGDGILTLDAVNTYTGPTAVSAGTLALGPAGGIPATSGIALADGAIFDITATTFLLGSDQTLSGNGIVKGSMISSGILSPGNSAGTLTFNGDLTLNTGSLTSIELAGLSSFDRISVDDALTYGGTLYVSFLDGYAPQPGDAFQIFKDFDSQSGIFESIHFAAPGYTGEFDYSTGTLTIAAVPEPAVFSLLTVAGLVVLVLRRPRRHA